MRERMAAKRQAARVAWIQGEGGELIQKAKVAYEGGMPKELIAAEMGVPVYRVNWFLRLGQAKKPPCAPPPCTPTLYDRVFDFLAEEPNSSTPKIAQGIGHTNQKSVKEILSRAKRRGFLVLAENQWSLA
jgi:hypothetical protein